MVQKYEEQAHRLAGVQNAVQEELSGIEKALKQPEADRNLSCSLCHYHETDQSNHAQIMQKRGGGLDRNDQSRNGGLLRLLRLLLF